MVPRSAEKNTRKVLLKMALKASVVEILVRDCLKGRFFTASIEILVRGYLKGRFFAASVEILVRGCLKR